MHAGEITWVESGAEEGRFLFPGCEMCLISSGESLKSKPNCAVSCSGPLFQGRWGGKASRAKRALPRRSPDVGENTSRRSRWMLRWAALGRPVAQTESLSGHTKTLLVRDTSSHVVPLYLKQNISHPASSAAVSPCRQLQFLYAKVFRYPAVRFLQPKNLMRGGCLNFSCINYTQVTFIIQSCQ